jgi:Protein of unknown function (DUF4435)
MNKFLNGHTLANDVRMRRSVWKEAFLFVEGDSDERLYKMFVDDLRCQIVITYGFANLIEACGILNSVRFKGFLGIADSDFSRAYGIVLPIPNVLLTDFHDSECFMLKGEAFNRVLAEFGSAEKLQEWCTKYGNDIKNHLLAESVKVGFLLWHSIRAKLDLIMRNLEIKEFVDRDSLQVDIERLINHTKNKSNRHDLNSADLETGMATLESSKPQPWQIVRGSDFIELLGYALRHSLGSCPAVDVSLARLEQSLRLAYSAEEFASTELFKAIMAWQQINTPYVILKISSTEPLF